MVKQGIIGLWKVKLTIASASAFTGERQVAENRRRRIDTGPVGYDSHDGEP